jgi:hypothetical protein
MKAQLLWKRSAEVQLVFGGSITIFMDCYYIPNSKASFSSAFTFSWIAFDPKNHDRRVLMDQHKGRPCHVHINERHVDISPTPSSLDDAIEIFWTEVEKHFGKLKEKF